MNNYGVNNAQALRAGSFRPSAAASAVGTATCGNCLGAPRPAPEKTPATGRRAAVLPESLSQENVARRQLPTGRPKSGDRLVLRRARFGPRLVLVWSRLGSCLVPDWYRINSSTGCVIVARLKCREAGLPSRGGGHSRCFHYLSPVQISSTGNRQTGIFSA